MDKARVGAMALLLAALPARATAQNDWWDWTLRDVRVRVEVGDRSDGVRGVAQVRYVEPERVAVARRYDGRGDTRYEGRARVRVSAPAFCRSGAGHPVRGRRWCVQRGYALGRGAAHPVRWARYHGDVVAFGGAWYRTRASYVSGRALHDLVGRRAWARLQRTRRQLGGRYALTARWLRPQRGVLVLQVRSGSLAIAELTDLNGDGRVDVFLVAER